MSQILDILLDKPDKIERALFLLMKSLVTIWVLNSAIVFFDKPFLSELDPQIFTSFEFFSGFSPFGTVVYILFIIITWIVLWEIIANWLLLSVSKLIIDLLGNLIVYFSRLVRWVIKLFKGHTTDKEPIIPEVTTDDNLSNFKKIEKALSDESKMKVYFGSLAIFHLVNIITKSSAGSQLLYTIISHEKTAFIKSRIQAYYTLIIFIFVGIGIVYGTNWVYLIISIILIFPTIIMAIMKDVFDDLESDKLIDLKLELPKDMYVDMVDRIFKKYKLIKNFNHTSSRDRLVISGISNEKTITVLRFISDEDYINLTPYFSTPSVSPPPNNNKFIVVSDMIPDIAFRNLLNEKGFFYLYVQKEEDLFIGLNRISPILNDWINLKE